VDAVIVGADRITGNGDTANKIGTYGVSLLARAHHIPFYVAAPVSTFDLTLQTGAEIPIEERNPDEVRCIGEVAISLKNASVFNPAFDVTPHENIKAIFTEFGVLQNPDSHTIFKFFKQKEVL
jgi:methylthioribose-1-phosphate isomerase